MWWLAVQPSNRYILRRKSKMNIEYYKVKQQEFTPSVPVPSIYFSDPPGTNMLWGIRSMHSWGIIELLLFCTFYSFTYSRLMKITKQTVIIYVSGHFWSKWLKFYFEISVCGQLSFFQKRRNGDEDQTQNYQPNFRNFYQTLKNLECFTGLPNFLTI